MKIGEHRYDDFSLPIRDLSAAKKSNTLLGSPLDCLRRDLILKPYKHIGIDGTTVYPWPVETGGERYSCATDFAATTPYPVFLDPSPEGAENILTNIVSCPPAPNSTTNISLLSRSGAAIATCQTN